MHPRRLPPLHRNMRRKPQHSAVHGSFRKAAQPRRRRPSSRPYHRWTSEASSAVRRLRRFHQSRRQEMNQSMKTHTAARTPKRRSGNGRSNPWPYPSPLWFWLRPWPSAVCCYGVTVKTTRNTVRRYPHVLVRPRHTTPLETHSTRRSPTRRTSRRSPPIRLQMPLR